jgi:hypothetical protein
MRALYNAIHDERARQLDHGCGDFHYRRVRMFIQPRAGKLLTVDRTGSGRDAGTRGDTCRRGSKYWHASRSRTRGDAADVCTDERCATPTGP